MTIASAAAGARARSEQADRSRANRMGGPPARRGGAAEDPSEWLTAARDLGRNGQKKTDRPARFKSRRYAPATVANPTARSTPLALLYRVVPAIDSLRRYGAAEARADFLAGVTVAAVAVPQAMAYAMVAGLPAQYGLYTAIVMTAVGAILDSSRQMI